MKKINNLAIIGISALVLMSINAQGQTSHKPIYFGVFGGAGAFSTNSITQTGTALYTPPLAVNAIGSGTTEPIGMVGGNIGYQWSQLSTNMGSTSWTMLPATELEGYYLQGTQSGDDLINNTERLALHQFSVSYPMKMGVFLANAVFNFNHTDSKIHPYIGLGAGTAYVSIHDATSTQTAPAESDINHYNSDPNSADWTFAAQSKAGLRFNLSSQVSLFAEYRFLYLAPTSYTFGSTQYATHIPTTNWDVDMGSLYVNMGTLGIQYDA